MTVCLSGRVHTITTDTTLNVCRYTLVLDIYAYTCPTSGVVLELTCTVALFTITSHIHIVTSK